MICQHCKAKEANYHLKQVLNGTLNEIYLCSECAAQLGVEGNGQFMPSFGLSNILSELFGLSQREEVPVNEEKCPLCGATMSDISKSGKIGCSECYNTFRAQLTPSIAKIHGTVRYRGHVPGGDGANRKRQLTLLKEELAKAIGLQEFERAAELRDQIRAMEREETGSN